jgi:hypothetical protein
VGDEVEWIVDPESLVDAVWLRDPRIAEVTES